MFALQNVPVLWVFGLTYRQLSPVKDNAFGCGRADSGLFWFLDWIRQYWCLPQPPRKSQCGGGGVAVRCYCC